MPEVVLIIGGTKEAASLAAALVEAHPDWRIITSLAGRTKEPKPLAGETRIGGFGGVAGLVDYIEQNNVTKLIDASHPFATQISKNVSEAVERTAIPLEVRLRPAWQKQPGDTWFDVAGLDEASHALPTGAAVLLALGSQHIAAFANRVDVHFVVRMVDAPDGDLPLPNHTLVLGKPSPDWQAEATLLKQHGITHIVCRNSGGEGAYAKVEAARNLGLPVIMINRPKADSLP